VEIDTLRTQIAKVEGERNLAVRNWHVARDQNERLLHHDQACNRIAIERDTATARVRELEKMIEAARVQVCKDSELQFGELWEVLNLEIVDKDTREPLPKPLEEPLVAIAGLRAASTTSQGQGEKGGG
jgi:hypothetical protein